MASTPRKRSIALDLLAEAHEPDFAATYFRDKVVQRPLYLKPTPKDDSEPSARDIRQKQFEAAKARKRKSPGKPKPLSAKRKRALQIYKIPKDQQKYDIYVPLHKLWCGYVRNVLALDRLDSGHGRFIEPKNAGPLLTSADFHGALVEVVRSGCVSRVGVKGIVVRDTKSTFEVITPKHDLKTIPKEHTVFRFEVPLQDVTNGDAIADSSKGSREDAPKPLILELHGSSFIHRAPDRATRKVKLVDMKPSEINS